MVELGKLNTLRIVKQVPFGFYLDGDTWGEILLPKRYAPANCKVGDEIEVFIYLDSEDEVIATTETPHAVVGEFAPLKVVAVTPVGAFLDWGLQKDLLVPFSEQQKRMQEGKTYLVYVYCDDRNRIVATSKFNCYLDTQPASYHDGEEVDLIIAERSDIGLKAIVDGRHWGILYEDDLFESLEYGDRVKGYIKHVRPDGKIDLYYHKPGPLRMDGCAEKVLTELKRQGGFLPLNDKSSPEAISRLFGESKKTFKAAIGTLYKQRLISIDHDGIRLKG